MGHVGCSRLGSLEAVGGVRCGARVADALCYG